MELFGWTGIVESPPREEGPGRWRLDVVAFQVTVGLDGLVYIGLRKRDGEETFYFLDVYSADGDFLARIDIADFGASMLRFFAVGKEHVLVCDVTEPFPPNKSLERTSGPAARRRSTPRR